MARHPLTNKDRENINRDLRELEMLREDIAAAKQAGVPELDGLEKRCVGCQEQFVKLKEVYFPMKK